MYNKLFTKILDSSIWLEDDATRLIWLTFLAAMDESGFCQFASVANLAHRARVSAKAAAKAVAGLEGPDMNSSDPDNEGRRIERVPGGWIVLNAGKYRELVSRVIEREQTRKRVAKHREEKRKATAGNGPVTQSNALVTPSEAEAATKTEAKPIPATPEVLPHKSETFAKAWEAFVAHRKEIGKPLKPTGRAAALKKLEAMLEPLAIDALNNAMANGWQGIFPDKSNGRPPAPSAKPIAERDYSNAEERFLGRKPATPNDP